MARLHPWDGSTRQPQGLGALSSSAAAPHSPTAWSSVITGVKASELLIFPKIFPKQQQPQQFSFPTGASHTLFGHKILSVRAAISLLCFEPGVELMV